MPIYPHCGILYILKVWLHCGALCRLYDMILVPYGNSRGLPWFTIGLYKIPIKDRVRRSQCDFG